MFAQERVDTERSEQFLLCGAACLLLGESRRHEFFGAARNELAERDGVLDGLGDLYAVITIKQSFPTADRNVPTIEIEYEAVDDV